MLTRWLLPLALVAATLAGTRPADAQEPSFDSAAALQKSGDFEAAAADYRRFLDAHPANVEARSNLGVVLMRLGRYEEAIAAYQTALSIAPSNATVRLNLGLAFYKSDQLGDAVRGLQARAGRAAGQPSGEISRGRLSAPSRPSG